MHVECAIARDDGRRQSYRIVGEDEADPPRRTLSYVSPMARALMGTIAPTIFWGPMAYAIMGGLLVAIVLTLIFLPALYVAWFRLREPDAGAPGEGARGAAAA
jgi:Transcription elongation factor, GreA/GreB, C-term